MLEEIVLTLRNSGGYAHLPHYGLIEVKGSDAGRFLQSQSTNDVTGLEPGQGQLNSLIDRTAHLQSVFSLHHLDDAYWLVLPAHQVPATLERLQQYHFNERLQIADISASGSFFTIQGPQCPRFLLLQDQQCLNALPQPYSVASIELWHCPVVAIRKSITGEEGFFFWVNNQQNNRFQTALGQAADQSGFIRLSPEALDVARIEAGIPVYGVDMSAEELLPDTALEQFVVSYTKGCYPGQEVIARIKTYSAPRKGLMGLLFPPGSRETFPVGTKFYIDGKEAGLLKSNAYSPTLQASIALAYVTRDYRVPGQTLHLKINNRVYQATVTLLPFYHCLPPAQQARSLYEKALVDFAAGRSAEAIGLLRESLTWDRQFADAYEMLGVMLSKQGELDEAIALMKKLVQIDPQSVMAHTNLSVFYMQQGNKEAAEEEKAISMSIRMEKLAREVSEKQQQEEQKQKQREDARERIAMFEQVLEIDAEDQLANYGLGNLYTDIEEYAKAIPYLQKALELKPMHSAAYLALSKAYLGVEDNGQAIKTLKDGIVVAGRRGDMMPLKEMQQCLSELEKSGSAGATC